MSRSINSLAKEVALDIENNRLDNSLKTIYRLVADIISEPLCTSNVFSSKVLDNLCQAIGNKNLQNIGYSPHPHPNVEGTKIFVYLVTKIQKSGGHTKLIEALINLRPDHKHLILSTELDGNSDITYINEKIAANPNISFERSPKKTDFAEKLTWLQSRLLSLNIAETYILNHHQDSVIIAAVQPQIKLNARFYHHGDHHLCLGVHLPIIHIDFHPMGYYNCRNILGVDNIYVPLTAPDKGKRPRQIGFKKDGLLTTCTAARSNKIEIPYFIDYCEVIPAMLQASGGKHIHIGKLTPWYIRRIKKNLQKLGVAEDRFIYIPYVASVWQALHEFKVDLYITSFPYGGGITLIEAMGAGVGIALHEHISSKILCCRELAFEQIFSWQNPKELIDYCAKVTPQQLQIQGDLARKHYDDFNSSDMLAKVILEEQTILPPPDCSAKFKPLLDELACLNASQINLFNLGKRSLYRLLKRLRAKAAW